jgi:hypothetical protein
MEYLKSAPRKPHKAIFSIVAMISIALILTSFALADIGTSTAEKDYVKGEVLKIGSTDVAYSSIWEKYAPLKIETWWGLPLISKVVAEGAITQHTDTCIIDCSSTIQITNYEDSALIDSIEFYNLKYDKTGKEIKRYLKNINSYQIYIQDAEKSRWQEVSVADYKYTCTPTGKLNGNGTAEEICSNVKVGEHKELKYVPEKTLVDNL